jgi:hypothetical protein
MGIDGTAEVIQQEAIGLPIFGIAATSALRDDDEAERLNLAQRRRNLMSMNAVFDELSLGDDQLAIGVAAVIAQFNFDAQ